MYVLARRFTLCNVEHYLACYVQTELLICGKRFGAELWNIYNITIHVYNYTLTPTTHIMLDTKPTILLCLAFILNGQTLNTF